MYIHIHVTDYINFITLSMSNNNMFVSFSHDNNNFAYCLKMHEMIWVVIEYQEVVFAGYPVDLLASF